MNVFFSLLFGTFTDPKQEELNKQLITAKTAHSAACSRMDLITKRLMAKPDSSNVVQFKHQTQ